MELKKWSWIIYILFALYFLNRAFVFLTIPANLLVYEKWVFVLIAALLLFGAYNSYKVKKSAY
jgi:hypothetical protein